MAQVGAPWRRDSTVVPEVDDFDIVRDDELDRPPRSNWLWIVITSVIALFAFAVGAAFVVLNNRIGPATPARTPVAQVTTALPAPVALVTATLTVTAAAAVTPTVIPSLTVTPTATPSPSPTPPCSLTADPDLSPLFVEAELGCARTAAGNVWAAWQTFEGGNMLWRSDTDTSYVVYANGTWFPILERWDGAEPAGRGDAPPGLQAPVRGFGYVWTNREDIYRGLGWATAAEKGFCALIQDFDRGFILRSSDVPTCTQENLYNNATAADFAPIALAANASGRWRSDAPAQTPVAQGDQRPVEMLSRPAPQGAFTAPRLDGVILDGDFAEWPSTWLPLNAIIEGQEYHTGPGDLSANFQVAWNATGLLFALRVNDETSRPGPVGTEQWRGDGLEIQFDRLLAEDFTSTFADEDDYQIGVTYDTGGDALRGYRWLPLSLESSLAIPGALVASERGYDLEFIIPWHLFEVAVATLSPDRGFGFNLAVVDNDGELPIQETVLSASPARTSYDDPTEWSTLRLLP